PATTPPYTLSLHDALPISVVVTPSIVTFRQRTGWSCQKRAPTSVTPCTRTFVQAYGWRKLVRSFPVAKRCSGGTPAATSGSSTPDRKSTRLNSSHLGISYA